MVEKPTIIPIHGTEGGCGVGSHRRSLYSTYSWVKMERTLAFVGPEIEALGRNDYRHWLIQIFGVIRYHENYVPLEASFGFNKRGTSSSFVEASA
jgi:hypothetical protein